MADLSYLSIKKAHELLVSKDLSAVDLTQYYLDRISEHDGKIRAVITLCRDRALAQARRVDAKLARDEEIGLLEGIPYTAKDMFNVRGVKTTAASHILEDFVSPYTSTVVEKLETAGAILLAKVNHDEFGHGSSTENSAFHPTHNPWDVEHVPGGSSGGSAAAVSADFGIFSLGTDTGGSSRQPAAYCGVTGYKPTYGAVSRYGVVAMASSLDTIGTLARTAAEVGTVMSVIAGVDVQDSTTIELKNTGFVNAEVLRLNRKTFGVVREYVERLDEPNRAVFESARAELESAGATVKEVSLPKLEQALPAYYILASSEISANLSRYDGVRYGHRSKNAKNVKEVYDLSRDEGFGDEAKRRIMTGAYTLSAGYYDAYYRKAMQVRTLLIQQLEEAFAGVDFLVGPTAPAPAPKFGAASTPVDTYLLDIMTVAANLAGVPAISLPAGEVDGLPIGLQIMAPQGADEQLIATAQRYQQISRHHETRPTL